MRNRIGKIMFPLVKGFTYGTLDRALHSLDYVREERRQERFCRLRGE